MIAIQEITRSPAQFTDAWLAGQLSRHTRRAYAADIRQFVEFVETDDLAAIGREDLHRYRGWVAREFRPASANRKLATVRQLFAEAVRQSVIPRSPADGLRGFRTGGGSRTLAPSTEQVMRLLESVSGDSLPQMRDSVLIYVLLLGLRRAEASALTVSSLTASQGFDVLTVCGKGGKTAMIGPVPATALASIRRWIAAADLVPDEPLLQEMKRNSGWHRTGRALTPNGVYYTAVRRMRAVGIEGCSPHSLRHWCATEMLAGGADIYAVQRWLRHADPRTTERYNRAQDALHNSPARFLPF